MDLKGVALGAYVVLVGLYSGLSLFSEAGGDSFGLTSAGFWVVACVASAVVACCLSSSKIGVVVLSLSAFRDLVFAVVTILTLPSGIVIPSAVLALFAAIVAVVLCVISFRARRAAFPDPNDGLMLSRCPTITFCVLALVPILLLPVSFFMGFYVYFARVGVTLAVLFMPAVAPLFALRREVPLKEVRLMGAAACCAALACTILVVLLGVFSTTLYGEASMVMILLILPMIALCWDVIAFLVLGIMLCVSSKHSANVVLPVQMQDVMPDMPSKDGKAPTYAPVPVDELPEGAVLLAAHPHAVQYADLVK